MTALFPPRFDPRDADTLPELVTFGRYDVMLMLDEDEHTTQHLARAENSAGKNDLCTLRRLKPDAHRDVQLVSRFIETARLAVRAAAPHLVAVTDFGRVLSTYYMATTYVDGITPAFACTLLGRTGRSFSPLAALMIAAQCADALKSLHSFKRQPFVFGDVRLDNMVLGRDGVLQLLLPAPSSVFCEPALVTRLARHGHLAPEVLAGMMPTAAADVWSVGAILRRLLVNTRHVLGLDSVEEATSATLARIVAETLTDARLAAPAHTIDVIDACTMRSIGHRPRAAELHRALLELLDANHYDAKKFSAELEVLDRGELSLDELPTRARSQKSFLPHPLFSARKDNADAVSDDATSVLVPEHSTRIMTAHHAAPLPFGDLDLGDGAYLDADISTGSDVLHEFENDPGPWGMVRVAEEHKRNSNPGVARILFKTAAIALAARGRLVPALCAYDGAKSLVLPDEFDDDMRTLFRLARGETPLRNPALKEAGGLRYFDALRNQSDGGIDRSSPLPAVLLSGLEPDVFVEVARRAVVRRFAADEMVLQEGATDDALYLVADGRLVVTCTPSAIDPDIAEPFASVEHTDPGIVVSDAILALRTAALVTDSDGTFQTSSSAPPRRVFVSALTAGDVFGEFSFLTSRPRSANVEAVSEVRAIEFSRTALADLLLRESPFKDALEAFYKERVIEWMLAKNDVFSRLDVEKRRALLSACGSFVIPAGKQVVREGELHDAVYFIKRGEVEVTVQDGDAEVFINKLSAGDFFGEIAAIEGGPRRASVRTTTELEVFRISRVDLMGIFDSEAEALAQMRFATHKRAAELTRLVEEQRRILTAT